MVEPPGYAFCSGFITGLEMSRHMSAANREEIITTFTAVNGRDPAGGEIEYRSWLVDMELRSWTP